MKMNIGQLGVALVGTLLLAGCGTSSVEGGSEQSETSQVQETMAIQEVAGTQDTVEGQKAAELQEAVETSGEKIELIVSAAASLKESMGQIETLYEVAYPNVELTFNFGGSGALQQQIEQGAPVDVFFSAALKQMKALEEEGLIVEGSKKELLENKVVLIIPADQKGLTGFEEVITDKVGSLGLGEPSSVPVGQYAEEVFTNLDLLETLKAEQKIVYANDVKEVLSWVQTGNVDAGVVYATDAKTTDAVTVVAEAPAGSYLPAIYPVAVVKESTHLNEAQTFVDFLSTDEAQTIFENFGFAVK